jgi:hypothetical protein
MKYARFLIFPIWYLIAMSCATQSTPMGGPKDTIPPTVIRYSPKENSKNFKGKEFSLEFSEAVVLNNPREEILIIPSTGSKTEFKLKGSTLTIIPENPLKDSTTYNINFREGVKDLTEGNPAKDLRDGVEKDLHLAFSTGPVIDTLSISGNVKNAFDEKIPDNITIALYTADTFDIFEDAPEYFTKSTKTTGEFSITNLKAGKYRLYAFEDKNKNLKAETRSEKFGFISRTIELDSAVQDLEVAMMNINTTKAKVQSVRNQSYFNTIRFNKSMISYRLVSDIKITSTFSNNQTEIIAYYPDSTKIQIDSLMIGVKAMDSTLQTVDTLVYIKRDANERIEEKFNVTNGNDLLYNLETNMMSYTMSYNKPLTVINNDSVYLRYDTITTLPLKYKSMKVDTMFNKITVNEMIPFDSLPKSPEITFGKGYLISVENDSSRQMTMQMKLVDSPTTAILNLNIQTTSPHFIIQILGSGNKVVRSITDQKSITIKFLNPESIKIRAIVDSNGNGVWDPAIYPQNREAEKVVYYMNAQNKPDVPLRANWDVGPLVFKF